MVSQILIVKDMEEDKNEKMEAKTEQMILVKLKNACRRMKIDLYSSPWTNYIPNGSMSST